MNVKELKEFLKDIDDDVEVLVFQSKYDGDIGEYIYRHDKINKEDLLLKNNKLFI